MGVRSGRVLRFDKRGSERSDRGDGRHPRRKGLLAGRLRRRDVRVGDAGFYGSLGNIHLNQPIVGMAATPDGRGYWLVASDGGVFAVGEPASTGPWAASISTDRSSGWPPPRTAAATGWSPRTAGCSRWAMPASTGPWATSISTNRSWGWPPPPTARGYWLVASDGGVFAVGDAGFYGSEGGASHSGSIVGIEATPDGPRVLDGRHQWRHLWVRRRPGLSARWGSRR